MNDLDDLLLRQQISSQIASAISTNIPNNTQKSEEATTDHENSRVSTYYDSYNAFAFKYGRRYASRFYLVVSILWIIILQFGNISSLSSDMPGFSIMIYGIPAFLIVKSIYELRRIRHLKDYNQVMINSEVAKISLELLAEKTGVSSGRVARDLRWLFKNRLMYNCSLIMDDEPHVILTDVLASTQVTNNEDSSFDWTNFQSEPYLNIPQFTRILNMSSFFYAAGVVFLIMIISAIYGVLIMYNVSISQLATTTNVYILPVPCFILLLCWFLRKNLELAVRCDRFFLQSSTSHVSCQNIASMMGWSLSKTDRILKTCSFLRLWMNCKYEDQIMMIF